MIDDSDPEYSGAVVVVSPWPVMRVLVDLYITDAPVPMFFVASDGGCGVPYLVIVLLFNVYLILRILNTMNIFQSTGVGVVG